MEKIIVCFSGGHASAITAIEAVRKYGKENVVLLNHDINGKVEHADIKRFKQDISEYLDCEIMYANEQQNRTPLQVCKDEGAFAYNVGNAICTRILKTEPFYRWLGENHPVDKGVVNSDINILYGFSSLEKDRIQRRTGVMLAQGYRTDYPLARWDRTIYGTEEIGIKRPRTYAIYKHANCIGCLKAGMQHWYVVYCLRPDIFQDAVKAENKIGFSIINGTFMEELIPRFEETRQKGVCPNERMNGTAFWRMVDRILPDTQPLFPCECATI